MIDTVDGARVLDRGRSKNFRFPWVVLCELSNSVSEEQRYVVWYEDEQGQRSVGYYTSRREDAQAEFVRRT